MYQRVGRKAFKKDLTNIRSLLELSGNPHLDFASIHVAGTNGKGSTSHMLASVFQAHGFKVGLYTSPHYRDFRERIKINGTFISKRKVSSFVERNRHHWRDIKPSFFEITVAIAFCHFAQEKVDIAIIETGLGGRLDSTNIIQPMMSVITNIGLDHMDMLGNTLPEIAAEKAGIIKDGVPVVVGKWDRPSAGVLKETARKKDAPIYFANRRYTVFGQDQKDGLLSVRLKSKRNKTRNLTTDLVGAFQVENLRLAWVSMEIFRERYPEIKISDGKTRLGLRSVKSSTNLIGRWQILQRNPTIICDSAHNEPGLIAALPGLSNYQYHKLHLVLGFSQGKDLLKLLSIFPKDATYYFAKPDIPRGIPPTEVQTISGKIERKGKAYKTVRQALKAAKKNAQVNDLIFVGGSSFVVAEVV